MKKCLKSKNLVSVLLTLFSILFIIYPTSYGIFNIKYSVLIFILISIGVILFRKVKININENYYFWIIIFLALITRIGIVLLLNSSITQISDFGASFINSKDLIFKNVSFRVFTHWIMYPVILNNVYKIFGYSQMVALLTNSFILVLVAILIYKISCILLKNKTYAFFTALIYIFWPANILYTLILTQEHLCALLLLSVLYLFLKLDKYDFNFKNKFKQFLTTIIIGLFLAFSTFLKNFALVFIVAFIIYFIIDMLKKKEFSFKSKYFISRSVFIIILFFTFAVGKNLIYLRIDNIIGERVVRNIIPCYLNVGFRDDGVYNSTNYGMYFEKMEKYDYDEDKVNSEIINELIDYWKNNENKHTIFELLNSKAKIIFGGDNRIKWINYSLQKDGNQELINFMSKYVSRINNAYFLCLVIFMVIGIIRLKKETNLHLFLCYLIFFGGSLLLLLVEAQNRYMYALQTILCILSGYGYSWYASFIKTKFDKN